MFGLSATAEFNPKPVLEAADRAKSRILKQRAEEIQADVRTSIKTSSEPSVIGSPPHTRGKSGHNLPDAVSIDVTPDEALIGPSFAMIGVVGEAFEFGRDFRGEQFDERPFMLPALMRNLDPFASDFAGSIN